jgi:hypothetical protein
MKFSRTFTNKLVSYADRYFTWDSRTLRREGTDKVFDFFAVNNDGNHKTVVCIDRLYGMLWVSIEKDDHNIYSGFLKSYKEVTTFKRMIRCLG